MRLPPSLASSRPSLSSGGTSSSLNPSFAVSPPSAPLLSRADPNGSGHRQCGSGRISLVSKLRPGSTAPPHRSVSCSPNTLP
jgi:hypothetical protein